MSSLHVEALEGLLRAQSSASDADLKVVLTRLAAEIRVRLARGSASSIEFIEASVRAISRVKGAANAQLRMTCLCDSGQYLFSNGRSIEALVAGAYCEQLARQIGNEDWVSKAQTLQSMANAELGHIAEAVIQCSKAMEIARRTANLMREASVLINLGIAFNYGGLYREAIPCYERVADLMKSKHGERETAKLGSLGREFALSSLSNKAQSHYELGEFEQGFAAIDECLSRCEEPWDALSSERRAVREFTYVQFALELGKVAAAREHAQLCYRYGYRANERADYHANVAVALCDIHGRDPAIGMAKLEKALEQARTNAERVTVLSCLIRSYDQIEQPEPALAYMRELRTHIRSQREAGVAALLSINSANAPRRVNGGDLDSLAVREAILRAKVAERQLVSERIEMFERLAVAADLKEEASGRHGHRVGRLTALLAEKLGWSRDAIANVELAARLHDIGKMAMPDRILLSSGKLRDAERRFMAAHTTIGSELLSKSNLPQLQMAADIARYHHEYWDGTGYPAKLAGKRIPIHARLVALADVFDALTHGRPYAPAWALDQATDEIQKRRGSQFDPDLTDRFLALIHELRAQHSDLDQFLGQASRDSPFLQARERIQAMLEDERRAEKLATERADTVH